MLWGQNLPREHGFEPLVVEGKLPDDLRGTLYRNGPAIFSQFGVRYAHPFEGDGAVSAFRLGDDGATGAVRITASAGLREERAAGRALYGSGAPRLRRIGNLLRNRQKNTANTNVIWWQGRLLALMEGGKPTELDPRTLETIGETDLDGVVVSTFSAHPHRVASCRTTYNFGITYGRNSTLHMYALPDDGPVRHLGALPIDGAPMLHDFIATDTHLIFFLSPVRIDLLSMVLDRGFDKVFRWRPELGTEVICVPLDRPDQPLRFRTEPFYQWHFANAFTRGRELLVDYVRFPDFGTFDAITTAGQAGHRGPLDAGRYHRALIDLDRQTLRSEQLSDLPCEFPRIHPGVEGSTHGYTWLALRGATGLGRFDLSNGRMTTSWLDGDQRTSEPVFVPRPGARDESDGHVLSLVYDGGRDRSYLAVHDGNDLEAGAVAKLWLDHRVPITFHGNWAPAER